ncbi:MAG: rRNA maturation RNase YbeY [Helicobacteraceae bacterium]|jgi:probable rRNA maturation factor|nr:rRNA maturation RNase YbeY [Helicobacteraceae bacterium]
MIDFENRTDFEIALSPLEKIAARLSEKTIELILMGDEEIGKLNGKFRSVDKATDVLSFPIEGFFGAPLGSVAISIDAAKRQAEEFGHSIEGEIAVLFLHGVLHLLGYDHERDDGEMTAEESALQKEFNLPAALIERQTKRSLTKLHP